MNETLTATLKPKTPVQEDTRPEWAKNTFYPRCPACGEYLLPCKATANGIHPGDLHHSK